MEKIDLLQTMDAQKWAAEFMRIIRDESLDIKIDQDFMVTWFANAIMVGYDHAKQHVSAREVINLVKESYSHPRSIDIIGCPQQTSTEDK
jgi:hypothetical protein